MVGLAGFEPSAALAANGGGGTAAAWPSPSLVVERPVGVGAALPTAGPGPSPSRRDPSAVGVVMFNNLEEAVRGEEGSVYAEAAFTLAARLPDDRHALALLVQPGLYYGVSDAWTLGVFPGDVSYTASAGFDGVRYEGSAIQSVLSLIDPQSSPVGLAVFGFLGGSERAVTAEGRLVLQRLSGPWNLTYNFRLGTTVDGLDGRQTQTTGLLGHHVGLAYGGAVEDEQLSRLVGEWSLGGELLIESDYREWRSYRSTRVYAGPTMGLVLGGSSAVTVGGLVQLTNEDGPRWTLQFTIGWGF